MTHIIVGYRKILSKHGEEVMSYSNSTVKALEEQGHIVTPLGEGHEYTTFSSMPKRIRDHHELFIDLDCGRNADGKLTFQNAKPPIPSVVRFIDTHGHPDLHAARAPLYDHVFFAVWDRRDIFKGHPSVHWCPNASDADYFSPSVARYAHTTAPIILDGVTLTGESFPFDVGFFGSKGGLSRADTMKEIAARHGWKVDVREMGRRNHRWPHTAQAMDLCKVLFNHGQKRDGPNQRVIESMLVGRPLVTDRDRRDGMSKLFKEGEHYLGYNCDAELANNIEWCLNEPSLAQSMANRAYDRAVEKHQVKHRVEQILKVTGV